MYTWINENMMCPHTLGAGVVVDGRFRQECVKCGSVRLKDAYALSPTGPLPKEED